MSLHVDIFQTSTLHFPGRYGCSDLEAMHTLQLSSWEFECVASFWHMLHLSYTVRFTPKQAGYKIFPRIAASG